MHEEEEKGEGIQRLETRSLLEIFQSKGVEVMLRYERGVLGPTDSPNWLKS